MSSPQTTDNKLNTHLVARVAIPVALVIFCVLSLLIFGVNRTRTELDHANVINDEMAMFQSSLQHSILLSQMIVIELERPKRPIQRLEIARLDAEFGKLEERANILQRAAVSLPRYQDAIGNFVRSFHANGKVPANVNSASFVTINDHLQTLDTDLTNLRSSIAKEVAVASASEFNSTRSLMAGLAALLAGTLVALFITGTQLLKARIEIQLFIKKRKEDLGAIREEKMSLVQTNNILTNLASTDQLTGLSNRTGGDELLERYFKAAVLMHSGLSLLLIDVDNFKEYNDTFGHLAGDEALVSVAEVMKSMLRTDDQAIRFGGEEFLIVLPFCDEQAAVKVAERIRTNVRDINWPNKRLTISIGAASLSRNCNSSATLQHEADQALYMAKNTGKNRTIHFRTLRLMMSQMQELDSETADHTSAPQ